MLCVLLLLVSLMMMMMLMLYGCVGFMGNQGFGW